MVVKIPKKSGGHPFQEMLLEYRAEYGQASGVVVRILSDLSTKDRRSRIFVPAMNGFIGSSEEFRRKLASSGKKEEEADFERFFAIPVQVFKGHEWGKEVIGGEYRYLDSETLEWMKIRPVLSDKRSKERAHYGSIIAGKNLTKSFVVREEDAPALLARGMEQFEITKPVLDSIVMVLERDLQENGDYEEFKRLKDEFWEHLQTQRTTSPSNGILPAVKPGKKCEETSVSSGNKEYPSILLLRKWLDVLKAQRGISNYDELGRVVCLLSGGLMDIPAWKETRGLNKGLANPEKIFRVRNRMPALADILQSALGRETMSEEAKQELIEQAEIDFPSPAGLRFSAPSPVGAGGAKGFRR